jgi:hypothetical protein
MIREYRDDLYTAGNSPLAKGDFAVNALDVLRYGHRTFVATLDRVPLAHRITPGVCGIWSTAAIVAHLTSYEILLEEVLLQITENAPTPTLDRWRAGPAAFNDDEVAQRGDHAPESLLAEYSAANARVKALAERIPVGLWAQTGTIPWYGSEYSLDDFIVYQYYGHKREHSAEIAAFADRLNAASAGKAG